MELNNHDQARIREYLLGRLSDEEQEKIEERLMVEDDLFEELEISKGELIEEYSSGELSGTDRQAFESGYLVSPEGRQRYTFSHALDTVSRRKPPKPAPAQQLGVSWFDQLRAFLNWRRLAFAVGSAAVVLAAVAFFMQRAPVFISVDLTSNYANRAPGAKQYRRVAIPSNADEVRFTLQLPPSATAGARYLVQLDNQTDTTTFTPLGQDQSSVVVAIPVNKLPPGIYELRLQAQLPDGTSQNESWVYSFEVPK